MKKWLDGKTAVITGGSSGIGLEIARQMGLSGARVCVIARRQKRLSNAVQILREEGIDCTGIKCDVSIVDECSKVAEEVHKQFKTVDVLVNSAGVNIRKPLMEVTEKDWDIIVDTNLKGLFFCTQAFAKYMVANGGGRVIHISSAAGATAVPNISVYSCTKAAVNHMVRCMAVEWSKYGILVVAIGPGYIETPLTKKWLEDLERRNFILEKTPLGRLGKPEEIARLAVFLASDFAEYITGATYYIDGGWAAP